MLTLRNYQQQCLDQLRDYLAQLGRMGAGTAFYHQTGRVYHAVPHLPGLPYVCLRVPTGGGKTLMACHTLALMAKEYLQQERIVCLWLVPSNTIREQTLKALRDRNHPYRQAIDSQFSGNINVMDLAEALYIQRSVLENETTIIVSTLAALRVEDTEGRKIYESAGFLQHHFSGLSPVLEAKLERNGAGVLPYSLANVLRLWEPVVIMDEAHNARTKLSFETLERFNPSGIIEFTATPQLDNDPEHGKFPSNVLSQVSAAQLKLEEMIKLPVRLHTRSGWLEILSDTIQEQRNLEEIARAEQIETGEYIRPLVLLQAQPHRQEKENITAEVVRKTLQEDFKIPAEQIAVATGATREIDGVDLFDSNCPIRYIITQQALKEGWDCSFAYIFCSVADIGSTRDAEQLLGRVLRLPQAKTKNHPELNRAYAMICSQRAVETLGKLGEALIENGFEAIEAKRFVTYEQPPLPNLDGLPLFSQTFVSEQLPEAPDLSKLTDELRQRIQYDTNGEKLTVMGSLTLVERIELERCFLSSEARIAIRNLHPSSQKQGTAASYGDNRLRVPALCIRINGELELCDDSQFIDYQWNLTDCNPTLTEDEFPSEVDAGAEAELDISDVGKIEMRFVQQVRKQLVLLRAEIGWTASGLVNWLDRRIYHPDITRTQATSFIRKVIDQLLDARRVTVQQLAADKIRLSNALAALIDRHRQVMRKESYQRLLFGPQAGEIETSAAIPFLITPDRYAPNRYYDGGVKFQHHAFPVIGDMNGEELACAQYLDQLPQIKRWVRNLDRQVDASFWLPTTTDKFYPDFIAELVDGRWLVVEYKGEHLWSNDDSKEKRSVGELWADRSGGKCLFVMPKGRHLIEIDQALNRK